MLNQSMVKGAMQQNLKVYEKIKEHYHKQLHFDDPDGTIMEMSIIYGLETVQKKLQN